MKRAQGVWLLLLIGAMSAPATPLALGQEPVEILIIAAPPQPTELPPARLPPLKPVPSPPKPAQPAAPPAPREPIQSVPFQPSAKALSLGLETVLQLSHGQNDQVNIARQRLLEAFALRDLAAKNRLPVSCFDQAAAFRRIDADREAWQRHAELAKLISETVLDAGGTYIDLLSARTSEAVAQEVEKKMADLLGLAQTLAKMDPGVRVEVVRIESEIQGQKLLTRKLREGARAAAARLIYLLGLEPDAELVLTDKMEAFELIDRAATPHTLVGQALKAGPGVRELEGMLELIEHAQALASRHRGILDLQCATRERRRLAESKVQQARLAYQDLGAKLTLGVHEALEASHSSREQMKLAAKQIERAEEAWRLSNARLRENIKGRSPSEVLLSIRALAGARLNYLSAIRDFDKAQLRLFLLTGCLPNS